MISVNPLNTPRTLYQPPVIKICTKVLLVLHQFFLGLTPSIRAGKEDPSVWNALSSASENMGGSTGLEKSQRLCGVYLFVLVMHRWIWWQPLGAPWITPASAAVMKSWLFASSLSQCHHLCWAGGGRCPCRELQGEKLLCRRAAPSSSSHREGALTSWCLKTSSPC